jgi:AcrR family transcriptional regulator
MMEQRSAAKSVTEVSIVEAAAQLFARHGFRAATTREIAHLADINEVTLFRYFLHKPDLFYAAVESRLGRVTLGRELQMSLAGDEEPALVVPRIVTFLLKSLTQQPELHRLLHVAAFELPGADKSIWGRSSTRSVRTSGDAPKKASSTRPRHRSPRWECWAR